MRQPRINGSLEPSRQKTRVNYDPQRGMTVTEEWEVAGDNLAGLAQQAVNDRIAFDYEPHAKKSSLVTTASGGQAGFPELSIDTWQLLCNETSRDLREHPIIQALRFSDADRYQEILQSVKDYEDEGPAAVDAALFTDSDVGSELFRHLIHGVTSYQLGQYVLRHTTNVSNRYDDNVADQGVETIYTTAQLLFEITNASYWVFPCPGRLVNKIDNMENQFDTDGFMWGWRKLPSQETSAAGNRIDISQEYWLGGWSLLAYTAQ